MVLGLASPPQGMTLTRAHVPRHALRTLAVANVPTGVWRWRNRRNVGHGGRQRPCFRLQNVSKNQVDSRGLAGTAMHSTR